MSQTPEEVRRLQEIHDAAVALGATCSHGSSVELRTRRLANVHKAAADDPAHPGWPAHTPGGVGGEFKPKDSAILPLDEIPADAKEHPVSVVDSSGKPILDDQGKPILRPAHLSPEFFVAQGLAFRERLEDAEKNDPEAVAGIMAQLGGELARFRQGRSWDAQRVNGKNVRAYRDYATIAIGLYAAAAGIGLDEALAAENEYARRFSHFDPNEPRDEVYNALPKRNVRNTRIGYELYESGRVGPPQR